MSLTNPDSFGSLRVPLKKRKPVTLIVGIIAKHEIILASDSRTTFPSHVQDDTPKITVVAFKHGKGLIGHAGYTALSGYAVDVIASRAETLELKHPRDFPEMAYAVLQEIFIKQSKPLRSAVRDVPSYLRDNVGFSLLLAFWVNDTPCIYSLQFPLCSIEKITSHYVAIGNSESLGNYLLNQYTFPSIDSELAVAVAVYVVETVGGTHDKSVGGPTQVGIVKHPSYISPAESLMVQKLDGGISDYPICRERCRLLPQKDVLDISKIASKVNVSLKQHQNKRLQTELRKRSEKRIKEILAMDRDLYGDDPIPGKKPKTKKKET